jgi:dTDP-4-amino-4,6-dideoxygalactose transaminase
MKIKVPFNNLSVEYNSIQKKINAVIQDVLTSGRYILGEHLKRFEENFAKYIGVGFCVGCASGTEAIALSLMAYGINNKDEVITTDMTAFPTITGIIMANARPVVVDINPANGLIDVDKVEVAITNKTRVIIPVHLYGQCVKMEPLKRIVKKYNLILIEDCAQAIGTCYNNQKAGSFGDISTFSFYPTKNLGAYGDGGAVCTDNKSIYNRLLKLRNYGQSHRYRHQIYGFNSRLDELQAAILNIKLPYLSSWNERRNEIARYYLKHLNPFIVKNLFNSEGNYNNYHLFVIKSKKRNLLKEHLERNGIHTLIHYPIPIRRQKAFKAYWRQGYAKAWNSDTFAAQIISLPIHPWLKDSTVEYIVRQINSFNT